jgi:hypothetical protein
MRNLQNVTQASPTKKGAPKRPLDERILNALARNWPMPASQLASRVTRHKDDEEFVKALRSLEARELIVYSYGEGIWRCTEWGATCARRGL